MAFAVVNSYATASGGSYGSTLNQAITPPANGNSLIVVVLNQGLATVTSLKTSGGTDFVASLVGAGGAAMFYYLHNVTTSPTSVNLIMSGNDSAALHVHEVSGLANAAPNYAATLPNESAYGVTNTHTATLAAVGDFVIGRFNTDLSATVSPVATQTDAGFAAKGTFRLASPVAGSQVFTVTRSGGASQSIDLIALAAAPTGPTVTSASSNSNTEGSAIVHTITLSAATTGTTNFAATLVGVSATGGGTDFTSALASLTYSAGVTVSGGNMVVPSGVSSFTVSIPTAGDVLNEANETYTLTVGGVSGTGTITDNDAVPSVAVGDATQVGGTVTHTITLSAASGRTVTVDYATANGTKAAGVDYTAVTGTLTFAPGETSKTVVVTVL